MNGVSKALILGLFSVLTLCAQDGVHTSTLTFGVGGETPTYNIFGESTGPVFNGNYEYRILKYLAVEGGFESMLPLTTTYESVPVFIPPGTTLATYIAPAPCGSGCVFLTQSSRTLVNLVPFGVKFVLPLASDRVELFAGGGGAYAFHSDGSYHDAMLGQANLGGRIAMDHSHRFWLGTSGHFFANGGHDRQEWLSWSVDFGIRF
jgi:hypothetical protein